MLRDKEVEIETILALSKQVRPDELKKSVPRKKAPKVKFLARVLIFLVFLCFNSLFCLRCGKRNKEFRIATSKINFKFRTGAEKRRKCLFVFEPFDEPEPGDRHGSECLGFVVNAGKLLGANRTGTGGLENALPGARISGWLPSGNGEKENNEKACFTAGIKAMKVHC